jgi:hypothetical protein
MPLQNIKELCKVCLILRQCGIIQECAFILGNENMLRYEKDTPILHHENVDNCQYT